MNNVATESEAQKSEHTGLSGVAPDSPVQLENKSSSGRPAQNPNDCADVVRTGQCIVTVRWRTGLSRGAPDCPVRPSPVALANGYKVVRGYKYPQPPQPLATKGF